MYMVIKKGDKVSLDYEGKFEDGTVFDSSTHGDHSHPLEFEVGAGHVIPGFNDSVIGMKKGEEKEFSIESKDAYGDYNPELKKDVPREILPKDQEPKVGMGLMMKAQTGQQIPAKIISINDKTITLDLNHPLAGKKLIFNVKVVDIK